MNTFLHDTANDLLKKYENRIEDLYVILPNKRTRFFFSKAFAEVFGKVHWAIHSVTLKNFVKQHSDLSEPDKLTLIFKLYSVYKKTVKSKQLENIQDFSSFYRLGEIILNDFNEIDNWLANPKFIFTNISDISRIDNTFDWLTDEQKELLKQFWSGFKNSKSSNEKTKFLQIRELLPDLYQGFKQKLTTDKQAYSGMIYRRFAENITPEKVIKPNRIYIIIGFNALNKAEETVFRFLKNNSAAEFYWDTDAYYHLDEKQEAGDFLRKNFKSLNIREYPVPNNFEVSKRIKLIGMPLQIGQAKLIHELLQENSANVTPEQTAVVLTDEHLLFPALYAIPAHIDQLNVTMGYPMKSTGVFSLIESYIKLHKNARRRQNPDFYYQDVINLLKHPATEKNSNGYAGLMYKKITEQQRAYIKSADLTETDTLILTLLFSKLPKEKAQDILLETLLSILYIIFNKETDTDGKLMKTVENEFIHKAYTHIKRFRDILEQNNLELEFKLLTDLLLQTLSSEQIPFTGKAQKGIQLMGVLETRNLDFKKVIVLGLNEGQFPSINRSNSFITENMRFIFGLPLIRHKDAVFSYLFYRLLQRAEDITLVYNNIVNDKNSGEISRFVRQLIHESKFEIEEIRYGQNLKTTRQNSIEIKKSPSIIESLTNYIEKGKTCSRYLSASALNSYMDCSLQFYYKYIAGITPADKIEEEVSHAAFGTVLHKTIENLYKNLIKNKNNSLIEKADFPKLKSKVPQYTDSAFKTYFEAEESTDFIYEGNRIIVKEVIQEYISKILKVDEQHAPFEIISLEDENAFQAKIPLQGSRTERAGLYGTIDRIDKKNGRYRIIDYKTGQINKEFTGLSQLFAEDSKNRNKHIFQIFFYGMLYADTDSTVKIPVAPVIYDVRGMHSRDYNPMLTLREGRDKRLINSETFELLLPDFKQLLSEKISELFDTEQPFQQTENRSVCLWCDYKQICNR